MLTVQDRWTWCCWVMMMAKGVRARPTSSSAWVSDTSVLRKIRSTTMPRSRTFRPTVSAYSLQLFLKHKYTQANTNTGAIWNDNIPCTGGIFTETIDCRLHLYFLLKTESGHTFAPCWRQSQNSRQGGQCRSAAGVLHSTVDTIHYADAPLVELDHLQMKKGWRGLQSLMSE